MDLSKILSISGKNGLYKMISQGKNNFIVESLEDQKRLPAFQSDGVSTLENISIYTKEDSVALSKLIQIIYLKQDKQPLEYKTMSDTQLREYFKEALPDYDEERVFISNIKKVYQWYNILLNHDLISIDEEEEDKKITSEPSVETDSK
jgi:hypothetical protein